LGLSRRSLLGFGRGAGATTEEATNGVANGGTDSNTTILKSELEHLPEKLILTPDFFGEVKSHRRVGNLRCG